MRRCHFSQVFFSSHLSKRGHLHLLPCSSKMLSFPLFHFFVIALFCTCSINSRACNCFIHPLSFFIWVIRNFSLFRELNKNLVLFVQFLFSFSIFFFLFFWYIIVAFETLRSFCFVYYIIAIFFSDGCPDIFLLWNNLNRFSSFNGLVNFFFLVVQLL